MQSFLAKCVGAASILGHVTAANFELIAFKNPEAELQTWYGDGELYMGKTLPANIETALTFTVTEPTSESPKIFLASSSPSVELPEDTFMAINNATGASSAVFFTNHEASLGPDDVADWYLDYNFIRPTNPGEQTPMLLSFRAEETEVEGTYKVLWGGGGSTDVDLWLEPWPPAV